MKYLGIDYGKKKVGIALSDDDGRVAFPEAILQNDGSLLETLASLIKERRVGAIVMGESRDFKGASNPIEKEARAFAEGLAESCSIPVAFEREFMTTAAALRPPEGAQRPSARKVATGKRAQADAGAAALILQSYLDRLLQ